MLLMADTGGAADKLYVDDLFSAYLRTGTGSDVTTTTRIDMTKGYMLWSKGRSGATDHAIYDSARGVTKDLVSNSTAAETTQATGLKAVSTTGHTIGSLAKMNTSSATYVDFVFRKAPKFFDVQTKSHTNGTASTVDLSSLGTVGQVIVKRTDSTGSWYVWHRSLTSGYNIYLEQTAAQFNTNAYLSVSGTTLTIASGMPTGTYVVYGFAHDTATDGIIQCGSFTTDASGNATVTLGWEPQFLNVKSSSTTDNWRLMDVMRGLPVGAGATALYANTSGTEVGLGAYFSPTATGFSVVGLGVSQTYIYLAIRRPNKPPTSGTQVYNAIARTGTGAAATVTGVGFAPDTLISEVRNQAGYQHWFVDRLRGNSKELDPTSTAMETTYYDATDFRFDVTMDGIGGLPGVASINSSAQTYINHFFRRAPGFMDTICFTGTGSNKTESHSLGKAPELWLVKGRSGATQWVWGSSLLANTEKIVMPSPAGKATDATAWNSTYPTSSVISFGTAAAVNTSSATYVCYMWATLAGVSKVFSYTGDGGSGKVINCGFSAGARFVLIVRTDTTGSFLIWDSVRGIVAANDPHLALDTTAAEVTTDDSIDPDSTGFAVNQVAATNINVNGATYIGLAIA